MVRVWVKRKMLARRLPVARRLTVATVPLNEP